MYLTEMDCSFQNLCEKYNLPGTSSMKAYGVPWQNNLTMHPIHELICKVNRAYHMTMRFQAW